MKYVQKGMVVTVDRGLRDDDDLFDRLQEELRAQGHVFTAQVGRNRVLRPKLTLKFNSTPAAEAAERWIEDHFES